MPSRSATTTTTTTTRTYSRSYNGNSYHYQSRYISPGPMYGGWGMGYGYSNGLLTGMIIGNMMHPYNTVMYMGPGAYYNNALLYPNGQVVNQQGYLVGNYINGQFTPVTNGAMVAQQVPQDAGQQQAQVSQPVIINAGPSAFEVVMGIILGIVAVMLLIVLIGVMVP